VVIKLSATASCYIANTTAITFLKTQPYITNFVYFLQALKLKTAEFAHTFHEDSQNKKQLRPQTVAELGLRNGNAVCFLRGILP
jgi:transcription antitermination factor NusG